VLLRNTEVFQRWQRLGLTYTFLGIEALDETGLELYRKRVSPDTNMQALECARRLGIDVAINLIVDRNGTSSGLSWSGSSRCRCPRSCT
jgi:magnesium-protoporphyrin IX monomethyl ester (oxidative) cyclase